MIVPMRKITVIVQTKDIEHTLNVLGRIGVLHIEYQSEPVDESVTELESRQKRLSATIQTLPDSENKKPIMGNCDDIINETLSLSRKKDIHIENILRLKREVKEWEEWGDFDPEVINGLIDKKIWVRLCKITKRELSGVPKDVILETLFKKGNLFYAAAISRQEIDLPFETVALPERSLSEMRAALSEEDKAFAKINGRLAELSVYKDALLSYSKKIESLIRFYKARAGKGQYEGLSYVRGFCPVYSVSLLEKTADREKWALIVEEPAEDDRVPTLIKNPRWVEIIRPVFNMIKTIPGYREVDISFWFLLFLSVFFGMLIGDAGYGAVFFIINLICHLKFKNKIRDKSIFFLIYVLSICSIAWGILSGTFFGHAWLSKRVEPLLPYLRNNTYIQQLCFFIGAIHLSIAHIWRFIKKFPSIMSLAEAGWICILWSAYLLANSLILGQRFPYLGIGLVLSGAVSIILFSSPKKNIFKSIASGSGELLFHVVNCFTDLVSYIRLFAVGAAGVAVADAFNRMAANIGFNGLLTGLGTALILLFGHILNILLGILAILVHGVRLNVLEFSSHLNMEWSGIEYAPFKDQGE